MAELKSALDLSCLTVTGKSIGDNIAGAEVYKRDVIHPLGDPVSREGATAVLTGNSGAARLRDEAVRGRKNGCSSTAARLLPSRTTTTWRARSSAMTST